MLRHAGDGELHLGRGAAFVRDDALVEMLLLAECDALIRYPPRKLLLLLRRSDGPRKRAGAGKHRRLATGMGFSRRTVARPVDAHSALTRLSTPAVLRASYHSIVR